MNERLRVTSDHSVITACLCPGLSRCIARCVARSYLVHMLKSGYTADSVALVPKCGTDTLAPVPKCQDNSDLS